jgi:hypothetical protein
VLNFPNPLGNETHMPTSSLCCVKHAKRHVFGGHLIDILENPTYTRTYSLLCILLKSWMDLIPTSTCRYKTRPLSMPCDMCICLGLQ